MHKAYRILMVLALIGMIVLLHAAGWAADTRIPKASEAVKSPVRVAPAADTRKTAKPDLVVSKRRLLARKTQTARTGKGLDIRQKNRTG